MFSNAGSLVDKLQGLFSKGFLVGGLVPLVLLFFINWGLLFFFFRPTYDDWSADIVPSSSNSIMYWAKVILIIFTGAVVCWSLNPWLRQCMEGKYLSPILYRWLCSRQRKKFWKLSDERDTLGREVYSYRTHVANWKTALADARCIGVTKPPAIIDPLLIGSFNNLKNLHRASGSIPFEVTERFKEQLKEELSQKPATGNELNIIHEAFIQLVDEVFNDMEYTYDRLLTTINQQFPSDYGLIAPTRMGNYSNVHREYGVSRFGLDIEHFWPRLLKVIRDDEKFYPMLEESKNQLDFSIAFTAVLGFSTFVWMPLTIWAQGFWPWVLVCTLGPIATMIAYQVAVQNYRSFSEVVRSAIDLNRFELLKLLHIDLPAHADAEKELWKKLGEGEENITYKHV